MKEIRALLEFIGEHPLPFIGLGIGFFIEHYLEDKREKIRLEKED